MNSDILRRTSPSYDVRVPYGLESSQFGDLRLPIHGQPAPVAVFLHGGFWQAAYDLEYAGHLCAALTAKGAATWNLEYRRVGQPGGGWPGTFLDVAAGVDHLAELAREYPLDLTRVIVAGHSAGGHLALWLAGRHRIPQELPLGGRSRVNVDGVLAIAGVPDLRAALEDGLRPEFARLVSTLMGGFPESIPGRYAQGSPAELLPLGVPQILVHGDADANVPFECSSRYVQSAVSSGDRVRLVRLEGVDHFAIVDPETEAGQTVIEAALELLSKNRVHGLLGTRKHSMPNDGQKIRLGLLEPCYYGLGFLRAANQLGYYVMAVVAEAKNPELYGYAPGNKEGLHVDEVIVTDVYNAAEVAEALQHHRLDAFIPGADPVLDVAAEVSRRLNLKGIDPGAAYRGRCKDHARKAYATEHLNPEFHAISKLQLVEKGIEEARNWVAEVGYPIIVKPTNLALSASVSRCNNDDELRAALQEQWKLPPVWVLGLRVRPWVLLEKFVDGPEFSVEILLQDGKVLFASVTEKHTTPLPYFCELGHVVPAASWEMHHAALIDAAHRALSCLGIMDGPAHVELRLAEAALLPPAPRPVIDGLTPIIMETNARPGGDHISTDLLPGAFGDNFGFFFPTLDIFLNRPARIEPTRREAASISYLVAPRKGVLRSVHGEAEVGSLPGVVAYERMKKDGDPVRPAQDSIDRLAYVITRAATPVEARHLALQAIDSLLPNIEPDNGHGI